MEVAGHRPRARQGAVGGAPRGAEGRAPLGAVVVLRGRGARDDAVLPGSSWPTRTSRREAFLTTQQVDEARHMQFFDRYYREVLGVDHEFIQERLAAVAHLTDAFVELFDERLVKMGERLDRGPSTWTRRSTSSTTYHMVIEGTSRSPASTSCSTTTRRRSFCRLPGGLRQHRTGRAPPRRRHLVPPAEVRRGPALHQAGAGHAHRAAAARRRRARARATPWATTTSSSATRARSRRRSPTARCRAGSR